MATTVDGTATVGTLNPDIKLPPAALRLPTLDFDPNGNPYYKFPPFLLPPDGVPLIPFDKFKPHGIEICLDSDVEEVDGEGIPTVELNAKHAPSGDKVKKRKKKRSKEGDEPKKSSPWWDDWGEGEDLRRAQSFDPNTPRTDRFAQGASDFQQNRKFSPGLQSLYDYRVFEQFRNFVGLLGHPTKQHRYGKGGGGEDRDDEDEDEEDDEAELTAEQEKEKQAEESDPFPKPMADADAEDEGPKTHEIDADYDAEQEVKEMKMDAFLNDPEDSMKIFFSSFYKHKGLLWSGPKLRDGPILLSFFLGFFIRNRLMPDYEKAFRKAYKVTEQARLELPQTTKISMTIPDTFGTACAATWGSRMPKAWQGKNTMDVDAEYSWPTPQLESDPKQEWEAKLKEKGMEKVEIDIDAAAQMTSNGWGAPMDLVEDAGVVGGWGDGATVVPEEPDPWAASRGTVDWGSGEVAPSLVSILGPTTLPLTHTIQLAEKSTRQIISFTPPNPDEKGLGGVLGTVVLAPWKDSKEGSTIIPPELLTDLPEGSTFDLARDAIRVFVDAKTVEVLREGMGLHAVFVQVCESEAGKEDVKDKKKSKRSRGKSKGKGSDDREWWYMEFLYEVIPSFWTEEGE